MIDVSRQLEAFRELIRKSGQPTSFALGIGGGQGLRINCIGFEPDPGMFASLSKSFVDADSLPGGSEVFNVFIGTQEEISVMMSEYMLMADGRNVYKDDDIRMIFSYEHALLSIYVAATSETFIWLCKDDRFKEKHIAHPFCTELSWWAQRHNMLLLHGASVGVEGEGVVISGLSGSGKSTLSMSALLFDMDFVSDDYLLLKKTDGEVCSRHIFSSGYLTESTLRLLPEYEDYVIFKSELRSKYLIDLDAFSRHLVPQLHIRAIVVPHIAGVEEPSISRAKAGPGLVNLIASSSAQNKEIRNGDFFLRFMEMVNGLPIYDMQLSRDIRLNAKYLKQWISRFQS